MSEQPYPRWNTILLSLEEAEDRLHNATFVLRLGQQKDPSSQRSYYEWGTGFFCTPDLALTADHNVRSYRRRKHFQAYYKGAWLTLEWLKGWSAEHADIAVMRCVKNPGKVPIDPLPVAYLDPAFPPRIRRRFWGGRDICIYGYPFHGTGQESWRIDGTIDTGKSLLTSIEIERDGYGRRITKEVERFNIHGSRINELEGISGAAIFDRELRCVIGVEGSYDVQRVVGDDGRYYWEGSGSVRGTEIAQLISEQPQLQPYFQPLFPPLVRPTRGIAVLARRQDEPVPSVVPISVRLCASNTPTGDVPFDNEALQHQSQAAVQWVGEYMRRFKGHLRRVLEEHYWGALKPYNCALFHLPEARFESLATIHAGMILVYLTRILGDILRYDLELPVEFPHSLFLCAAGFTAESSTITGEEHLVEALQQFPFPGPATVVYARSQQKDLVQLIDLPQDVRLMPVDVPEDVITTLLAAFIQETRSAVETHVSQRFKDALSTLLAHEETLKVVQAAGRSREARLHELDIEIRLRDAELGYLKAKTSEIRQKLSQDEEIPPPSYVLEEYTRWLDKSHGQFEASDASEDSEPMAAIVVDPARVEDAEICKRLYRRVAYLCYPDMAPQESEWFPHLVDHRHDRLWLEAMEGALEPLGSEFIQPELADGVSVLFDRLFSLHSTRVRLREKINELQAEVDSYGGTWTARVDGEIERAETMLRMMKFDIDQAWRTLNYLVGKEPSPHEIT